LAPSVASRNRRSARSGRSHSGLLGHDRRSTRGSALARGRPLRGRGPALAFRHGAGRRGRCRRRPALRAKTRQDRARSGMTGIRPISGVGPHRDDGDDVAGDRRSAFTDVASRFSGPDLRKPEEARSLAPHPSGSCRPDALRPRFARKGIVLDLLRQPLDTQPHSVFNGHVRSPAL